MKLDVRDLREGPVTLTVNSNPESLEMSDDDEFRFQNPVTGQVQFHLVGSKVLAKGEISTLATANCVRCLTEVDIPITGNLDAIYENDPELLKPEAKIIGNADLSVVWFDGEHISPESEIRESIMLELPSVPICSETCKGLCPKCGANLNVETCRCGDLNANVSSWKAALNDLKLD